MARRASTAFGTNVGGNRRRVSASDLEECRSRNGRGILYHHQHGPWDTTRNRRKRQAVRYAGRIPDRSGHLVLVPHCEILWPDQTASQASEGYQASGQADQVATQAPCRDLERPHCGRSQETLNSFRLQCGWAYSSEYSLLASELTRHDKYDFPNPVRGAHALGARFSRSSAASITAISASI